MGGIDVVILVRSARFCAPFAPKQPRRVAAPTRRGAHGAPHHPDKSTRRHGVYHPELEPLHMPDFATLRIDLFPNRMSDTLFLAEMSSSEQEKAELLNRAQQAH